ncbi:hypothetical protein HY750_02295, partial [Candidatus Kuenenbacteria bacterium]|nr:hypothetical protein [Candidatus Kuenenbacteria bacterium]
MFFCFIIVPVLAEWNEPTGEPGTDSPLKIITINNEAQIKEGALTVSTKGDENNKGLSIGDWNAPIDYTTKQNLIYGIIGANSAVDVNLMLLQTGTGVTKFKVDKDGNTTIAGEIKANKLCIQEDCKA